MAQIHVISGRLYSTNGLGLVVRSDELALLTGDDVAAITTAAVVGPQNYTDSGSLTMTNDGRLRVDASTEANLFAAPSAFSGNPWSSKSPW
jgi:hypothetical protein